MKMMIDEELERRIEDAESQMACVEAELDMLRAMRRQRQVNAMLAPVFRRLCELRPANGDHR